MTIKEKLKLLKFFGTILIVILIPIALFYLFLIIPEYCACSQVQFEGEKGIDIYGSEIDCGGENQAFSEAFFQIFSLITGGISLVIIIINIFYYRLKKQL
ncbi:hypothetical protein NG800_002400 [Epilithonimonas ginsengisoli]|uniref:Uncharacterized protein n=1 Tax=Epilithonimonas ginsengisoli TaxID=1245592 RepID=A0ABU4JDJ5_9FLAO|nr:MULTISPECIES: hypothetical protein [Chryseobacterium group]MBV6878902.1 hypothetical protein [Epilithonimonas sp. FP105]MDW8547744.1 hypothetical protein [Epilithonimonas ginsengisoli]OAH76084.1 hypothetical protein AXA65_02210 [Chryseobacterium sp. FP211-J200]